MRLSKSQLRLLSDYSSDVSKAIMGVVVFGTIISQTLMLSEKLIIAGIGIIPSMLLLVIALKLRKKL